MPDNQSVFIAESIDDLAEIADKIWEIAIYKPWFFKGDLGSGKTSLIKALLKCKNPQIEASSPSYSIVNEYPIDNDNIYHMDLYRLKSIEELLGIGFEEYLHSGSFLFIEWPQLIESMIDQDCHHIDIEIMNNEARKIIFR